MEKWKVGVIVGGSILGYVLLAALLVRLPPLPWVRRKNRFRPPARSPPRAERLATSPLLQSGAGGAAADGSVDGDVVMLPGQATGPRGWLAIAHRGGSLIAPENTLLAFRRAIAAPTCMDVLELDVHESADGIAVVAHDFDLARITGGPGTVKDDVFAADPAKLPKLATRIPLHFHRGDEDAYVMSDEDLRTVGPQRMCTLEEVFAAFPATPLHIELKAPSATLVASVIDMLRTKFPGRGAITVLGSAGSANIGPLQAASDAAARAYAAAGGGNAQRASAFAPPADSASAASAVACGSPGTLQPPFATFASAGQVVKTYLLYYTGLLPLVPLSYDVFDFPLPTAPLKHRGIRGMDSRGCLAGCVGRLALWLLEAPGLWQHLRRRGVWVFGFVQNLESEFAEAATEAWPIDGIMTDDPYALRRYLASQAATPPPSSAASRSGSTTIR